MVFQALLTPQALLGGAAGFLGGSVMAPISRVVSHSTNNIWPNEVLDVGSMIRLSWTHPHLFNRLEADQRLQGYSSEKIQDFLRASIRWPTVDEILQLVLLGKVSPDEPYSFVDAEGTSRTVSLQQLFNAAQVPVELQTLFTQLRERPLPLGSSIGLFRRFGEYLDITDQAGQVDLGRDPIGGKYFEQFRESKRAEGYENFDPALLFDAFRQYPGVPDLIRFAVREVYTPEIRTRFELDGDLPNEYLIESRKAGLNLDDAKRYWAAHWNLPSITQGFEMFQRRIIDENDLKLLLRSQDVMPFWRDRLIQLSYRVKRLVDIDRFYEQRVIPRIDPDNLTPDTPLIKEFMFRGYSFPDARDRAIWVDRTRPDPGTEAVIKAATRNYEKGFIDDEEYESILDELILPKSTKEFLLTAGKVNREQKRLETTIKRLKPLLLDGIITEERFITELQAFNLSSLSIRNLIEEIEGERGEKAVGLTESQVLRLYKGGYLKNVKEGIDLLIRSGRTQRAAEILIKEADDDLRTGANVIPFDDMKGFYSTGRVTAELFTDYLQAKGMPEYAINAYLDLLKPDTGKGFGL